MRYVDAVSEKDVYKITPRDKPWERLDLRVIIIPYYIFKSMTYLVEFFDSYQ